MSLIFAYFITILVGSPPGQQNKVFTKCTVKKYLQDLLSQHFFFCQINLNNVFSSDNLLF